MALPNFSILSTLVLLDRSHFCVVTKVRLILTFVKDRMAGLLFIGLQYWLKRSILEWRVKGSSLWWCDCLWMVKNVGQDLCISWPWNGRLSYKSILLLSTWHMLYIQYIPSLDIYRVCKFLLITVFLIFVNISFLIICNLAPVLRGFVLPQTLCHTSAIIILS
jgi:hypothetical protein